MPTILLIDDDKSILSINQKFLNQEGFHTIAATSASAVIKQLSQLKPDCIVMDIMMPRMNGFDACKTIKEKYPVPIILLSGLTSEDDKIHGLSLGADDYIVKPYSLRELSARIKVQLKHNEKSSTSSSILRYPPLSLNYLTHTVTYNDQIVSLSNREYQLLYLLLTHPNQTVTFEQIGIELFGQYLDSDRKTIMVTASRLRKKLSSYVGLENMIETSWSKGYQFNP